MRLQMNKRAYITNEDLLKLAHNCDVAVKQRDRLLDAIAKLIKSQTCSISLRLVYDAVVKEL